MEPLWQTILVAVAFVVALVYLVRYQIKKRQRKSICESCPAMQAMKNSAARPRPEPPEECCEPKSDEDNESSAQSNEAESR